MKKTLNRWLCEGTGIKHQPATEYTSMLYNRNITTPERVLDQYEADPDFFNDLIGDKVDLREILKKCKSLQSSQPRSRQVIRFLHK